MLWELKTLFAQQAEHELLQTTRDFHSCKQEEGQSVSSYVLKMKGYIDNIKRLGHLITLGLGVSLILIGLRKEYDGFVQNYNMHSMGKTVNELHAMLKLHEQTLPKTTLMLFMLFEPQAYAPKPKIPPPPKREDPAKNLICHECGETGHWKRNCPQYLAKLLKKKKNATSGAGGSGEYMSQEFLDHLKDHGIIAHRTPPYTPQHNENRLINQEASGSLEDLKIIQEEDTHPSIDTSLNHEEDDIEIDEPQSDIVPIRRSTRTRHAPDRMCLYIDAEEHELRDLGEPANYKATLLDPESEKWLNAMNVKMQSMKDNEVWVLVELPPNGKIVGSKWLFKKKTDMDGVVHTYKARLMAKGYTQTSRIDYKETFSLVADIRAIRILIAIAAYYDYEIWQMDVKTDFLNGYLNEEVYMEQPEGFVNLKYPNRCKSYLGRCFAMKVLDEATYILGIKIYRDRSRRLIGICQSACIEKILKRYCMENSKRGSIPMQEKLKLSKSQGASTPAELKRMQNVPYASAVGSIMYAVRCTRPDVAFAQNVTSRFQQNPGDLHWTAVKNILKYLRNTKDMFLVYGGDLKRELRVSCYTNAGYLTNADNLKSQTGYVFILNGGAVDWKSAKQSIFATSSTKAEYIAAFDASKEAVWAHIFVTYTCYPTTIIQHQDVLKVGYVEGSFQVSEDSWKSLEEEKESTFLSLEANLRDEVETLSTKLKSVHLERVSLLVKGFLPSIVKKLMASNHFSLLMADLEQKAMMFGSAKALNDVLGFGDSWKLEDIKDYDPEVEKNYDETGDAFFKLEFPYVTLLIENADRGLDELAALESLSLEHDVIQALPVPPS
uniref:Retrotransposon protein, putative, Ty1-copia subclass n=1 Tax=Tanacetum cinerariifolium TaxID=118510 RepID=A0A6L2MWB9_TANCI|nr:retrotransposon protein, putative, Ty1-copia subclass [Tanacetum cinerariifolium]